MTFTERLARHRKEIRDTWTKRILGAFPPESVQFIGREKDRFRNPIGSTLQAMTDGVLDVLEAGGDREALRAAIEDMVRLRAVQVDRASQAVSFVLDLRDSVREVLGDEVEDSFESRMEDLLLDGFDLYMQCREKVFEIRVAEHRNRTWKLLEREGEISLERGGNR
jgi:hypothetical protein